MRSWELAFWSESGVARDDLLTELRQHHNWGGHPTSIWKASDLAPPGGRGDHWILTASEYHGGQKILTRVSLVREADLLVPFVAIGIAGVLAALGLVNGIVALGSAVLILAAQPIMCRLGDRRIRESVLAAAEGIGLRHIKP